MLLVSRRIRQLSSSSKPKSINHGHCRGVPTTIGAVCGNDEHWIFAFGGFTPEIYDSSAAMESICFGSYFTPHSPAARPAFSFLHEGLGVAFGAFNFQVTTAGTLRLQEQIRSAPAEPAPPSGVLAPASPSSVGSSGEPDLTPAEIYCVNCGAHHAADLGDPSDEDSVGSLNVDLIGPEIRDSGAHPTRFLCAAILGDTSGTSNGEENERVTINVSQEAWDRAKAAVTGGNPLPDEASREDLMAYDGFIA